VFGGGPAGGGPTGGAPYVLGGVAGGGPEKIHKHKNETNINETYGSIVAVNGKKYETQLHCYIF
jgi:hypothetical protein